MKDVELAPLDLPDFGLPTVEPRVPPETYEKRIKAANMPIVWSVAQPETFVLVIYGDREHFANIAYLSGYDPRFEEALLILPSRRAATPTGVWIPGKPVLVVGNEGWGYAEAASIEHKRVLYQNFSLLGQPRDQSPSLEMIFREAGIQEGSLVGVVGWKSFSEFDGHSLITLLDIPSYIADTLREITGKAERVQNVTGHLMDAEYGLRATNDVDQLAVFEFAATHTSQALRNVLFGLKTGMTEYEAVQLMNLNGMPHSVHLMLSSGPRAAMGLPSPSSRVIQQGDPFTMAFGLWGGLNARAGFAVREASELPEEIRDYVDKLVKPYFSAIVDWYEHVGIGVTGGELYEVIHRRLSDPFFGVKLNPGHLIHLDEWVNSPIYKNSNIRLKSGMALQVDVIPGTGTPYFTTNIEDGIALADEELRAEFERKYPEAWGRIQARRTFMWKVLGINLKPEVLPFSNIPAYLTPYVLNPHLAMRVAQF